MNRFAFFDGLAYNVRGLWLGLRTPKLLFLGLFRFASVILITVLAGGLILRYHQEILAALWSKPDSLWLVWLWYVVSWLVTLFLVGMAAILSYLLAQILFNAVLMDYMSRITERKITGREEKPAERPFFPAFLYLVKQEIPRAVAPLVVSLFIMIFGWFTPLGPVTFVLSSVTAAVFLAWDNTDLTPARRMVPFRARWRLLIRTLPFHLGFGLLFLVPGINIILLSFAPVGATLYFVEKKDQGSNQGA